MRRTAPLLQFALTVLLLLVAASRILRIAALTMNPDEVWSIWQTFGTPTQIIQWTPYDWPPGYYLTLGLWRWLTGFSPITLRYMAALTFVLGSAALYRAVRRQRGSAAGFLAVMAYAALGYATQLTSELRGYALMMGVLPFAYWGMLRYFARPTLWRAALWALPMAALFYLSLTSAGAWFGLGLCAVLLYGKRVWRAWLPAVLTALLVLPELLAKLNFAVNRTRAAAFEPLTDLPSALVKIYRDWAGGDFNVVVLGVLFALAVGLLVWRGKRRVSLALLVWALLMPLLMYISEPIFAFFSARYAWWIMLGIALALAWGLAELPRWGRWLALLALCLCAFAPLPERYNIFGQNSPLESNLLWLRDQFSAGDVLLLDPNANCGASEEWDTLLRMYYPAGLPFVENATGHRRVWYISEDGRQTPELYANVQAGRIEGRFVGPARCLFRLYQAPPDSVGVLFENGMRFHGLDVMLDGERLTTAPLVLHEGESLHVRLWWSADAPLPLDYSVAMYVLDPNGAVLADSQSAPQVIVPDGAPAETSRWQSGVFYVEERTLTLPYPITMMRAQVALAVYFWQDGQRLHAEGVNADGLLPLRTFTIMAW